MRRPAAALVGLLAFAVVVPPANATPSCAGSRQTSDPLSPACIATWTGNNGGETWDGVTGDTVTAILYNDIGIAGNLNSPWQPADETSGHLADPTGATTNLVRTAKALVAHFNARYQTYGRTVRVIGLPSVLGETAGCEARLSDARTGIGAYQPFAIATVGKGQGCVFEATDEAGIVGVGNAREIHDSHVPPSRKAYTFGPTIEQESRAAAGFVCRTLRGKPARFAQGDIRGRPRTFGLIYPAGATWFSDIAASLSASLLSTCGQTLRMARSYLRTNPSTLASAVADAARPTSVDASTRTTTLICLCPGDAQDAQEAVAFARALAYQPEWLWLPSTRLDRATWARMLADPTGSHFGISPAWLAPEPDAQQAFRAARDGDPGLDPNERITTELFLALRMLFTGVQLAGPTLNPTTFDAGLTGFAPPTLATLEYVPGSFADPGPRTWTDSFTAWWFDATSTASGDGLPRGCSRLIRDGARFSSSAWPTSDHDLFDTGVCTGDLQRQPIDQPTDYALSIAGPPRWTGPRIPRLDANVP